MRAGLFAVSDLADVPLVGPVFAQVSARYPGLEEPRLIQKSIRRLIDAMVNDLIAETAGWRTYARRESMRSAMADAQWPLSLTRCARMIGR